MSELGDGDTIAVDTAVWMDALLFGGSSEELVKLGMTGRVRLVTSEILLGELAELLQRGLDYSDAAVHEVLRFIRDTAEVHDDLDAAAAGAGVPREAVLDIAHRAGATCVATTDGSALAPLDGRGGIPVISIG